jgi:selenocysteine-specific elongation factor
VTALVSIAMALAQASPDGEFDAAGFRNRSGIGRNLTVEVLEYLDRAGHTRFLHGRRRMAQ